MTSAKRFLIPIYRAAGILLLGLILSACEQAPDSSAAPKLQKQQISGPTMGTTYHISVCTTPGTPVDKAALQQEINSLLELINQQMSTYIKTSELSLFNQANPDQWVDVAADVVTVVDAGLKLSIDSDGAFDMTVGPLVNLWHFGPDPGIKTIPTDQQIAEALKKVGYKKITVRDETPALKKSIPDVYLDLSAIAKGYAVDRVGELLEAQAIENYLVEIGGEMRARGVNDRGQPWKVGIEKPVSETRVVQSVVPLSNLALATSGNYRNFFEVAGISYSHTIDPRTGRPVEHRLASVTVVGETCMNCDATATCLMVLGPEAGYNWAKERKIAAYFMIKTENGFRERFTPRWHELLGEENKL